MIGLKNSYEIAYNGTENECRFELYADTAAEMVGVTHYDGIKIQMGSEFTDISTGDRYLLNGSGVWVLQPSANAWQNVYTKPEIDSMITEIYGIIAYYHTTLVSDTGEITFYALAGYIGTWKIYGNGQQTGTPTPDNPVMPTFCGVRTAQLFDKSTVTQGYYISDTNGELNTGATYEQEANASDYIPISGDSVTFFSNPTGKWRWGAFYDSNKTYISGISGYNKTYTIPENARYMRLTVVDEILDTLMVNLGSTALPYEPFGYKIPISCGGETTPVYLGEVPTVRRVKKLVLDGTETWTPNARNDDAEIFQAYISIPDPAGTLVANNVVCSHLETKKSAALTYSSQGISMRSSASGIIAGFAYSLIGAVASESGTVMANKVASYLASEYAAGTPIVIWYVLAEPETAIVNEPLAKIGDYADELHSADAGVAIPTAKGNNTLTVDTELKPSRIEIQGGIMHE